MAELITSASNPKIKKLLALQQKSSERRESALFVVEGRRELEHCLNAGYKLDSVFVCKDIFHETASARSVLTRYAAEATNDFRIFEVSKEVYAKIAVREGTEGIIAEVKAKKHELGDLELGDNCVVLVIEGVEKPGNIGAMLRTCDAAGVDALIICDPRCDIYNPNLIRASIGAAFTVPVAVCPSEEAISFLKSRNIRILTAQLQDSSLYYDCDMKRSTAIVMGTEADGLSDEWREAADAHIRIPMLGRLDSLNVSVSAAILLYESVRQKHG